MSHRVLVGMEVHLQLRTKSKMFSTSPVQYGAPPNTLVDPVVLGLPGALPVPNRDAMTMAIALATAIDGTIAEVTKFDRKNYFYPDLPKGYQISQFDQPLSTGGGVEIVTEDGSVKTIRIRRLHLEEDVGKSVHDDATGMSRVDFNRAGTPLVEIVTEPDIASAEEARSYLNALRTIVQYLDISDGNMQEGNMRCEPNVNVHIETAQGIVKTPIVEVKNLNSVRNVERAVILETERALAQFEELGAKVADLPRCTHGYDDVRDQTFVMREKEEAHDYRYFPEPDIPPIHIDAVWRAEAEALVPELPAAKRRRFAAEHGLNDYDADTLCRERTTAEFFEAVVAAGAGPKPAVNWILTDLNRHANERKIGVADLGLDAERLAAMIGLVEGGVVARKPAANEILPRLLADPAADPAALVKELGLAQIEDDSLIREASKKAVEANPRAVADYKGGKEKALGALMGFVMRELKGKANSAKVRSVLIEVLGSS